jgi:hypothetical protein
MYEKDVKVIRVFLKKTKKQLRLGSLFQLGLISPTNLIEQINKTQQ